MIRFHFPILAICLMLCMTSCESKDPQPDCSGVPLNSMVFVKFKASPEHLNYVIAEPDYFGEEERLCTIRGVGGTCQELYLGSSPYIALPKGYFLIDWKWGDFVYEPTNMLIDIKWTDVQDRHQKWEYPSKIISEDFIKEIGYISYQTIDKYLNIAPPKRMNEIYAYYPDDYIRPHWEGEYHTYSDIPETQRNTYLAEVKKQDSLRTIYIKRLSQIIEAGAVDDAGTIYKY